MRRFAGQSNNQDIEIILVDDGSPDSCPSICDGLAEKDDRIKVVHKPNGGLSSARNAGMKIAQGKYIGFVDSDDDVELDMYERMFQIAEEYKVDFVMADYLRFPQNGEPYLKTLEIAGGIYYREKIISDIFPALIMGENIDYGPLLSVWHCLYRHDFLDSFGLFFDEDVRWSEDNIFSAIMGYHCDSFYYMKGQGLYHYYSNPGSITTSYRKGAWKVYCTMNDHLTDFFQSISEFDFSRQLKLHMIYYACNCMNQTAMLDKKEALQVIRDIVNDNHLIMAFKSLKLTKETPLKLRLYLKLLKYRQARLICFIDHH